MTLRLPKEKIKRIVQDSKHALARRTLSVRAIARLIGRMSAVTQAVLPAPLYYRALQRVKNTAFKASQSFDVQVELSAEAQEELNLWIGCLSSWNGRALIMGPPEMTVESDASLLGWGALSGSSATGGLWNPQERQLHINVLEALAGSFAVKTFTQGQNISARQAEDGQLNSRGLCEPHGWNQVSHTVRERQRSLAALPGAGNSIVCGVSPRLRQHHSGLSIQAPGHVSRMEAEPQSLSASGQNLGSLRRGADSSASLSSIPSPFLFGLQSSSTPSPSLSLPFC